MSDQVRTCERPGITYPRMVFSEADQINLDESLYVKEMGIQQVVEKLPDSQVWKWNQEPGTRAGDIFVFQWATVHHGDGTKIEFPDVFIQIEKDPVRHPSAKYWWAPFTLHGVRKVKYMARSGSGSDSTTTPTRAIDDAPLVELSERVQDEWLKEDSKMRSPKRELEREQEKRAELKGAGPGKTARIRNELRRAA